MDARRPDFVRIRAQTLQLLCAAPSVRANTEATLLSNRFTADLRAAAVSFLQQHAVQVRPGHCVPYLGKSSFAWQLLTRGTVVGPLIQLGRLGGLCLMSSPRHNTALCAQTLVRVHLCRAQSQMAIGRSLCCAVLASAPGHIAVVPLLCPSMPL